MVRLETLMGASSIKEVISSIPDKDMELSGDDIISQLANLASRAGLETTIKLLENGVYNGMNDDKHHWDMKTPTNLNIEQTKAILLVAQGRNCLEIGQLSQPLTVHEYEPGKAIDDNKRIDVQTVAIVEHGHNVPGISDPLKTWSVYDISLDGTVTPIGNMI